MRTMLLTASILWIGLVAGLANRLNDAPTTPSDRPRLEIPASPATQRNEVERHSSMTERMRITEPSKAMRFQMNNDEMWQMMRDPSHIRAEEEYQRGLDRMLARRP